MNSMFRQHRVRLKRWFFAKRRSRRVVGHESQAGIAEVADCEQQLHSSTAIGNVDTFDTNEDDGEECLLCSASCCKQQIKLCSCTASICKACMEQWFKTKPDRPTCPACNQCLDPIDLAKALGMDHQPTPAVPIIVQKPPHEEVCDDTLTDDWIVTQDDTKRCPQCHVWITREGGGYHAHCGLCQHDFCWICRIPMHQCDTLHSDVDSSIFSDDEEGDEDAGSSGDVSSENASSDDAVAMWSNDVRDSFSE